MLLNFPPLKLLDGKIGKKDFLNKQKIYLLAYKLQDGQLMILLLVLFYLDQMRQASSVWALMGRYICQLL